MTKPISLGAPPNSSYYDTDDQACGAEGGSGGAGAASGAGGSHGAGNIDHPDRTEGDLPCLPEVLSTARSCGRALLVRNVSNALSCAESLAHLQVCVTSREH